MEYIVVRHYDKEEFTKEVNEKLKEGFELSGGVSYCFGYDPHVAYPNNNRRNSYAQALIKPLIMKIVKNGFVWVLRADGIFEAVQKR